MRLFCLPFAGAGASSFAPLAPAGRHSRGLCGAVAGAREPHAGALHRLGGGPGCGTRVLDAGTHGLSVRNSRLQHGASIALELCRRLRGGILPQPVALFVVGAPGPRVPKRPRSRASPRAVRRRASPARWYIAGDPRELGTPRHISSCPARRLRPERIIRLQSTGAPRFRRLPMPVSPMRSPPVSVERWSDEVDGPFRMRRFAGGHFSSRAASKPSLTRSCATSRGGWCRLRARWSQAEPSGREVSQDMACRRIFT